MSFWLVFNQHSLPFENEYKAVKAIPPFIRICLKANNKGLNAILVNKDQGKSWFHVQLAEDYYWRDWYNKYNKADKDLAASFLSIVTRTYPLEKDVEEFSKVNIEWDGDNTLSAIQVATFYHSPLVSFPTEHPWDTSPFKIDLIVGDGRTKETVHNLHNEDLAEDILDMLQKENDALVESAKEIVKDASKMYPSLVFCEKMNQCLLKWKGPDLILNQSKETLRVLDSFVEKWRKDATIFYSDENLRNSGLEHKVSGESDTVKNKEKLRKQREFRLPTGIKLFFEKHVKLSEGYRLYFYPDESEKVIYIGYVGSHLDLD